MNRINHILTLLIFGILIHLTSACADKPKNTYKQKESNTMTKKYNPVVYFEIPVTNMERAIKFYKSVLHFSFEKEVIDNNEMALFPFSDENAGISGALAKGEIYKPTKDGVVIYFNTLNIDETLKRAVENGGQLLYPKTSIGDLGFVAEFQDSEGNRIALHQSIN
jgi:predicted enzyme related to lactoylglutathione lyase